MSEPTTHSPTGEVNPTPADVPNTETQGEPVDLGDNGKKALEAERKRAAKAERDLKAMQTRLDEIEAAKLSDLEKAQKVAGEAQAEAERARAEVLRYKVAAKHGISDEDAVLFLTGADEETLIKQAERLAEREAERRTGVTDPLLGDNPRPAPSIAETFAASLEGRL